eukprot:1161697-Pelagomonas_calceolata.AAC.5
MRGSVHQRQYVSFASMQAMRHGPGGCAGRCKEVCIADTGSSCPHQKPGNGGRSQGEKEMNDLLVLPSFVCYNVMTPAMAATYAHFLTDAQGHQSSRACHKEAQKATKKLQSRAYHMEANKAIKASTYAHATWRLRRPPSPWVSHCGWAVDCNRSLETRSLVRIPGHA